MSQGRKEFLFFGARCILPKPGKPEYTILSFDYRKFELTILVQNTKLHTISFSSFISISPPEKSPIELHTKNNGIRYYKHQDSNNHKKQKLKKTIFFKVQYRLLH